MEFYDKFVDRCQDISKVKNSAAVSKAKVESSKDLEPSEENVFGNMMQSH